MPGVGKSCVCSSFAKSNFFWVCPPPPLLHVPGLVMVSLHSLYLFSCRAVVITVRDSGHTVIINYDALCPNQLESAT